METKHWYITSSQEKSWPFIISSINSESYILHNIKQTPATSIEIYHLSKALVKWEILQEWKLNAPNYLSF